MQDNGTVFSASSTWPQANTWLLRYTAHHYFIVLFTKHSFIFDKGFILVRVMLDLEPVPGVFRLIDLFDTWKLCFQVIRCRWQCSQWYQTSNQSYITSFFIMIMGAWGKCCLRRVSNKTARHQGSFETNHTLISCLLRSLYITSSWRHFWFILIAAYYP